MKTKKVFPILLSFLAIASIASTAVLGNTQNAYAGEIVCFGPSPLLVELPLEQGETSSVIKKGISCVMPITDFDIDTSDCTNKGIDVTFENAAVVFIDGFVADETITNTGGAPGETTCNVVFNFLLTGGLPGPLIQEIRITTLETVVGGEFLQIDNTALLLAGIQSSATWMIPVVLSIVGIGLFVVSRKSENS